MSTAMEQFEAIRQVDATDEPWRWRAHVLRMRFDNAQMVDHPDSRTLVAGICSPLDIIHDLPAFAAGRGGITYAIVRPTRADLQRKHRELRRARRIDRRAWLAFSRLTYRLWLRPRRWRDAWNAHHERWSYQHGCDGCW